MDKLRIIGGNTLHGTVRIDGAKNAALPILAASILAESRSTIRNVPPLSDVYAMLAILESLGAVYTFDTDKKIVSIDTSGIKNNVAPYDMVRKMRASICLLGPLLARFGDTKVSMPGGCVIGQRPVDLHIKGLSCLNVSINIEHGYIVAQSACLKGGKVFLGGRFGSSVLATANVMLAAVKARGITRIECAACEPEIVDLAQCLNAMGAKISNAGSHTIIIEGVDRFNGVDYTIIPDRIEAGTYMIAGAVTRSKIMLENANADHLMGIIDPLMQSGVSISAGANTIEVDARHDKFQSVDITTLPYPGFPTDLQAQMMAFMTTVSGISIITEKIFPERFMHIAELNRMAASVSLESATAIVKGGLPLSGAPVMASDLRASAALVIAALRAQGMTEVHRIYHLERGYYKMEEKLKLLGANIEKLSDN